MEDADRPRFAGLRNDYLLWGAAALLFLSLILGGGGAEAPAVNGLLEALGALLLCATIASHFAGRPLPPAAAVPAAFIVAMLVLVAAQLVPLPPSWWSDLPGRQAAVAAYGLTGDANSWRPLSLDPEATRRFAASLLLPAGMFLATLRAGHDELRLIARIIVGGALISATLGAVQLTLGLPDGLFPYGRPGAGVPTGLFANPNHQAQLMLAGLVLSGLLVRLGKPQVRIRRPSGELRFHMGWLLFPVFMMGAVMTQSRAGIVLMVPAALAATLIAAGRRGLAKVFALSVAAIGMLAAVAMLLPGGSARGMELQMELSAGGRITSFPDILYTLGQFWPWGSGFGTFVPVFKANEDLDRMGDLYLNHAHNDLLELLIEGGAPVALLLTAGLIAMVVRLWRWVAASRRTEPVIALAGLSVIILMLVHSLVDYPLRMRALAAVAAVALAFFLSPAQRPEARAGKPRRRHRGFARGSGFSGGFGPPAQGRS